jgi:hypothetical protein
MEAVGFVEWLSSLGATLGDLSDSAVLGGLTFRCLRLTDPAVVAGLAKGLPEDTAGVCLFSDEWQDRRAQCEAFVLARLGRFERRVGARACEVREVPRAPAAAFMERYHIQGANTLGVRCFGLYRGDELLGVLSLGRHSRQIAPSRIVLDRLCFQRGVQVVGGASKLLQHAIGWAKGAGYREILSYSDNRWTSGGVYLALGFSLDQSWKPDYSYVKDGQRFSKQSQKKDACGCPGSMTELEWAHARGLVRIYDAGKKRWLLNLWPGEHETRSEKHSKKCAAQHQQGVFKHAHIRGYFPSQKNNASVYFGSSYELRCLFLLEADASVTAFRRCDSFKGAEQWRNPDLLVTFEDGRQEVWEVKPEALLEDEAVHAQVAESLKYAAAQKLAFRVWTEKDSALPGEHAIIAWARKYLETAGLDPSYAEKQREIRQGIRSGTTSVILPMTRSMCTATSARSHTRRCVLRTRRTSRATALTCVSAMAAISLEASRSWRCGRRTPTRRRARRSARSATECSAWRSFSGRKASFDGLSAACRTCLAQRKRVARAP